MTQIEKISVVVIEDNHDLNSMMVEDLKTANFSVSGFHSVEDFNFSNLSADVIVLDINLPGENGFEFATRVRKIDQKVQIIALSARSGSENRVAGYRSGIDVYLEKPVSSIELLAVVNRSAERLIYNSSRKVEAERRGLLALSGHVLSGVKGSSVLKDRERSLLVALLGAQERRLSYESCAAALGNFEMKQAALEVFVGRIRQKMKDASGIPNSIQAIRGWGYALSVTIAYEADSAGC